jgi:flavin reductase (DIM6/NTAB) family NADH-FMN oxidoreductase RutF
MFYRPEDGHGLPHNPFNAIVTPRPIGWISTRGGGRVGEPRALLLLQRRGLCAAAGHVRLHLRQGGPGRHQGQRGQYPGDGRLLREHRGIRDADVMNRTSGPWPKETDEFDLAGIERAECETILCSRVAGAPASLECRMTQIVKFEGRRISSSSARSRACIMRDDCLKDGVFDVLSFNPLTRMGYRDYSVIREKFSLSRPGE